MEPARSPVRVDAADGVAAVTGPIHAWIAATDDPDRLPGYAARVAAAAGELMRAGAGAVATCHTVTALHDNLTVRLIQLAEAELGAPPVPYTWLALGSGGRMEQALYSDQDNAIVYAATDQAAATDAGTGTGTDADADAARRYFAALGARVVDGLARAGLRRCPGGYMADRWHLPLPAWLELFGGWIERPEPKALVEAEVFLDFRAVSGELSIVPLDAAFRRGAGAPRFLVGMARAAVMFAPPLGLTGRIRSDHDEVDLKRGGLAAAVLLARLYALAAGSLERSTPRRLAAASAARTLSHDGAVALADAHQVLSELRLAGQLRQLAAGAEPGNRVRLRELAADERGRLRQALHTVRDLQRATALRFHTETVL